MRGWVQVIIALVCMACGGGSPQSAVGATNVSTAVRDLNDGQVVDGVPCLRDDLPARHSHIHLALYLDGKAVTVPAGLGVGRPWGENPRGFIATGGCFAWIHTHDATGVVHVFTQIGKSDSLGQVFSVWGQPLDTGGALGFRGTIAVLVNGQPFDGDPRSVPLKNLENIVLELGKPPSVAPPALYDFGTMRR
jgi:hypothetical protein